MSEKGKEALETILKLSLNCQTSNGGDCSEWRKLLKSKIGMEKVR